MAGRSIKPVKYVITQEMHTEIARVYKSMTGNGEVRELAKKLALPRWKMTRYAESQGWIAKRKKVPDWSERELGMLERLAYLSPERISARMKNAGYHRSAEGVRIKRNRMRFLQAGEFYTARQTAECFGIDVHCILRWIRLGALKAERRGTKRTEAQGGDIYMIRPKWVRKFVLGYTDEVDIRKVDKYWFVDLLAERRGDENDGRGEEAGGGALELHRGAFESP